MVFFIDKLLNLVVWSMMNLKRENVGLGGREVGARAIVGKGIVEKWDCRFWVRFGS